jgi:CDP-glucose 4,6-dehydratase
VEDVVTGPNPDPAFWAGKRVLVNGHTGFKGAWLCLWLARMGAEVSALSLPPESRDALFTAADLDALVDGRFGDLRDLVAVRRWVRTGRPEIVIHMAAQALVRAGYADPEATYATNVMGTVHILEALRHDPDVRVALMVTSDKVYSPDEAAMPFPEGARLGGLDPYSASKAACETVIASYRDAYLRGRGVAVASARAGNVIGGGDWAADRLLPDLIRAWRSGVPARIRNPNAVRPWQHVLDPLLAYLILIERLWTRPELSGPYNIGPTAQGAGSVSRVVELAQEAWGGGGVVQDEEPGPLETARLTLNTEKTARTLGIPGSRWPLDTAVAATVDWYRRYLDGGDARALCADDIDRFLA